MSDRRRASASLRLLLALLFGSLGCDDRACRLPTKPDSPSLQLSVSGPTQLVSGQSVQIVATYYPASGNSSIVTSSSTWATSDTAVANVDSAGKVTAIRVGTVDITATYQGVSSTTRLSVILPAALPSLAATVTVAMAPQPGKAFAGRINSTFAELGGLYGYDITSVHVVARDINNGLVFDHVYDRVELAVLLGSTRVPPGARNITLVTAVTYDAPASRLSVVVDASFADDLGNATTQSIQASGSL